MNSVKKTNRIIVVLAGLMMLSFASACSASTATIPPGATVIAEQTQQPIATETTIPTATPQPRVALVGFSGSSSDSSVVVQETLQELAAQNGLLVEQFSDLAMMNSFDGVQLIVVASSVPGIDSFAAGHPSLKILVIGQTELQPGGNLSLVISQSSQADQKGFVAGYLASVITQDWRVGVITLAGSAEAEAVRTAFNHGVVFYCGLCRPVYPPFFTYPVYSELAEGSTLEAQQAAADVLIANAVETVYVEGGAASDGLLEYLAQSGVQLIGDQPPSPAVQGQWVASIQSNIADSLRAAWERIMSGESGFLVSAPLSIQAYNEELLSSGRLRLVEQLLDDFNKGYIGTGVDMSNGE